jgi:hypothetical protein
MSFKIYQVYHKKELESNLLNKPYIIPYYTLDNKGINHLQTVLNEFVCQYYVYKYEKYKNDDIVGFCHYGKYYNIDNYDIKLIENEVRHTNTVYGLEWFNLKEIFGYNNKKNFIFITLNKYISNKYPEMLNTFQNFDWDYKSIRFECFICRYDDFCKYVEFVLGYFKYMDIDFETCSEQYIKDKIDTDKFVIDYYRNLQHGWYLSKDNYYRRIAYIIEMLCGIYWSLIGKNINILYTKRIFK